MGRKRAPSPEDEPDQPSTLEGDTHFVASGPNGSTELHNTVRIERDQRRVRMDIAGASGSVKPLESESRDVLRWHFDAEQRMRATQYANRPVKPAFKRERRRSRTGAERPDDQVVCPLCHAESFDCPACGGDGYMTRRQADEWSTSLEGK